MIDIKDIITLDDNCEYVVSSKAEYGNKQYFILTNINNNEDIKICYLDDDDMVLVTDNNTFSKLLPLFYKNVKETL